MCDLQLGGDPDRDAHTGIFKGILPLRDKAIIIYEFIMPPPLG